MTNDGVPIVRNLRTRLIVCSRRIIWSRTRCIREASATSRYKYFFYGLIVSVVGYRADDTKLVNSDMPGSQSLAVSLRCVPKHYATERRKVVAHLYGDGTQSRYVLVATASS
jgi:hypothetical protein